MYDFVNIVQSVILLLVELLSWALLFRAVLSWFPLGEDNKIAAFFYFVTEPIIMPTRLLFEKFGWGRMSPIDIPFLVTALELSMLYMILSIL